MKGFELSEDYKELWELIQAGYRIPAWVVYTEEYDEPIYDIVEVKITKFSKHYQIGYRGYGCEGMDQTQKSFEDVCKWKKLRYIKPNK